MSAEHKSDNASETSAQTTRLSAMTAAVIAPGGNDAGNDAGDGAGNGAHERSYAMFGVRDLTADGALFAGPLFFELDEEFTAELALDETTRLRVRARVMSLDYSVPGMVVAFSNLSAGDRELLTAQGPSTTKS